MYDNVIRYAVPLGKHIHLFLFIDYRKLSVSKFGSLIFQYSKKLYFPYTANSVSKPSGIFLAFCNKLVHDSFSLLCKMLHNNRFYRNKKKYHECHSVIQDKKPDDSTYHAECLGDDKKHTLICNRSHVAYIHIYVI